jgi:ribosomal protein S27AE
MSDPQNEAPREINASVAINYECPKCGEFQVNHSYQLLRRKCGFCEAPVIAVSVDCVGIRRNGEWKIERMPSRP